MSGPDDDEVMAFLRLLASTVRMGADNYPSFIDDLIAWMGPIDATGTALPEPIRSEAAAAAATLAQLARQSEAAQRLLGSGHGASPLIEAGLPLLRALADSYAMVAGAGSIAELDAMPLVMPEELAQHEARAEPLVSRWAVPLDDLA